MCIRDRCCTAREPVLGIEKAGVPLSHRQAQHGGKPLGLVQLELGLAQQLVPQGVAADVQHTGHILQLVAAVLNVGVDQIRVCHGLSLIHI